MNTYYYLTRVYFNANDYQFLVKSAYSVENEKYFIKLYSFSDGKFLGNICLYCEFVSTKELLVNVCEYYLRNTNKIPKDNYTPFSEIRDNLDYETISAEIFKDMIN